MSLTINGEITKILDTEEGVSKAGKEWQKVGFILKTDAEINPDICFTIFGGEKVEKFLKFNKVGDKVEVSFNLSSREFNGKYYHNLDAWKVWREDLTSSEPTEPMEAEPAPKKRGRKAKQTTIEELDDDLPF